jgi:hypothetical protein
MGPFEFIKPIPAAELGDEADAGAPRCADCDDAPDLICFDGEGYYCEACMEMRVAGLISQGVAYARQHCAITTPLPEYDPSREEKCTREEYATGFKESYSPNAYRACCRHNCTNYEGLIKGLDKHSHDVGDRILYTAIRERIEELLDEYENA